MSSFEPIMFYRTNAASKGDGEASLFGSNCRAYRRGPFRWPQALAGVRQRARWADAECRARERPTNEGVLNRVDDAHPTLHVVQQAIVGACDDVQHLTTRYVWARCTGWGARIIRCRCWPFVFFVLSRQALSCLVCSSHTQAISCRIL